MPQARVVEITDCTEFRQTLAARPPAIVHGAALLMIVLLAAALTWSALVEANLVVRAHGRVRPIDTPARVFTSAAAQTEWRVVESNFEEGDRVQKGAVLVRMDARQLDNRIARLSATIEAAEAELQQLNRLEQRQKERYEAARRQAEAELAQAEYETSRRRARRESAVRQAEAELALAEENAQRIEQLQSSRAATAEQFSKAEAAASQAREKLLQAQLPIDQQLVVVKRLALDMVRRDYEVQQAETAARRAAKQGEAAAAHRELANLRLEREAALLVAPIDGVIVAGRVQPGDVLAPGKPVVELARQEGFRFETLVPSKDVGRLRVGMAVKIKFDAYHYQKYGTLDGTVRYLSPDSRVAENADPEGGAATPPAFLVRIDLSANEVARGEFRGAVKLGLGGTAEIVTGRESILTIFLQKIRQTISLG